MFLSNLILYVYLVRGVGVGSTCAGFIPEFHFFLCQTLFMSHYCIIFLCQAVYLQSVIQP